MYVGFFFFFCLARQVSNLLSATCALVDHQLALRRRNRAHTASSSASSAHANAWEPVKVVEFCGGAGYVALPLAAMYGPEDVFVLLLDMKVFAQGTLQPLKLLLHYL
jgi:hypothetical protein